MRYFGMVLLAGAALVAVLMSFTTAAVDLGYRIGGGTFERASEPCGSMFGMLVLNDYRTAVEGERPPQAQAIDPDGSSLREQCELVARSRLVTMASTVTALVLTGIVMVRIGQRRERPMDDLRPLPKRK
jgi:hypothetical protein